MRNLVGFVLGVLALAPIAAFAQTLSPSQDAYCVPGSSTNYGTATALMVGGPSASIGLVQSDLTALPPGTTASQIQKAVLTLFLDQVDTAGTFDIFQANGSRTELGVNGTNTPAQGAAVASGVSATTANTFISVDATAAVQGWLTVAVTNNGFMITPLNGTSIQFDSKENLNTSHPATLTIMLAGPVGPTGASGPTGRSWSVRG